MNDDAVEEERRRVHLDGAAQETVEDPHVPGQTAELHLTRNNQVCSFMSYSVLLTSRQMQLYLLMYAFNLLKSSVSG